MVSQRYLVRVGSMGHVGRFCAVDGILHDRHSRVICRTDRGLEVGQVLAKALSSNGESDGDLLRRVSVQDDLLLARIQQRQRQAFRACADMISGRHLPATLVDVEHLFDGQSIFFYFLGEVTSELENITKELAEVYEAKVQFREFARNVADGCGPGCGTDDAKNGCGSTGCSSCSLSAACGTRR